MRFSMVMIFCLLGFSFPLSPSAHADTYQDFRLAPESGMFIYGMDDSGLVVFRDGACEPQDCYFSYVNGVSTGNPTFVPPVANWDFVTSNSCNAGQCSASLNGRTVTVLSNGTPDSDIFLQYGSGPLQQIGATNIAFIFGLDGLGDIVFDDASSEYWYELLDVSSRTAATPEPSSLALLGTGIAAAAGLLRRRMTALA